MAPWTTSLILHLSVLITLGVVILVSDAGSDESSAMDSSLIASEGQDEWTSLGPVDRTSDSFTTLTPEEVSAFSPPPKGEPDATTADMRRIFGPGAGISPSLVPFGFAGSDDSDGSSGKKLRHGREDTRGFVGSDDPDGSSSKGSQGTDIFSGRSGEARGKLVAREGGTVDSEKAVELGLDWLARHQRKDGSWGMNDTSRCIGEGCRRSGFMDCDAAATGLALLPLLGAGHSQKVGRYRSNVQRGLAALIAMQKPSGEISSPGDRGSLMYSHSIATMALCEAAGMSGDKSVRPAATLAIQFIVQAQDSTDGGWRYNPGDRGDTSVFGWAMLALRAGHLAHIEVPKEVFLGATNYLAMAATDKGGTQYSYMPGLGPSPVMSAEALLARQYLGWPRTKPELVSGCNKVSEDLFNTDARNIYYWYYATQLLHNMQDDDWKRWNPRVRDRLISMQTHGKDCDRGSWDPARPQHDQWGGRAGRHFTTAMSLLTLEVYYRYLPLYKAADGPISDRHGR